MHQLEMRVSKFVAGVHLAFMKMWVKTGTGDNAKFFRNDTYSLQPGTSGAYGPATCEAELEGEMKCKSSPPGFCRH